MATGDSNKASGLADSQNTTIIEVDVLVVGAGPAGAGLASFLGQNGIKGLMISRESSTSDTPRAHFTNVATMEIFRDIGIDYDAYRIGYENSEMGVANRHMETIVGHEYLRDMFGGHPEVAGQVWENSPCRHLDLGQTEAEPLLVRYATQHGFKLRFDTEFIKFENHPDHVISYLRDNITGLEFRVKSRFLCGADGARSRVAQQLELPFVHHPTGGLAISVLYEADLSQQFKAKDRGLIQVAFGNQMEKPDFCRFVVQRTVRPWTRFAMSLACDPHIKSVRDVSEESIIARTKEFIGYDPPDFKVLNISYWRVNESYAEKLSGGNVFCLGDAVHRHPPTNGLGSNTCIQDAYNLAWKMAYVLQGRAGRSILDSFDIERQPVAKQIVTAANDTIRQGAKYWAHLGTLEPSLEKRKEILGEMTEVSRKGRDYRNMLKLLHQAMKRESLGKGVEMNQLYTSSPAVYTKEEKLGPPVFDKDPHFHHQRGTYPGFRVPHAWLSAEGKNDLISTIDLCGHGEFTIITGIGGKATWTVAAAKAMAALPGGLKINVHSIGPGEDYQDAYWMWDDIRGVEEDGAVLVRPDRYVGWRSEGRADDEAAGDRLVEALRGILSL